MRVPVLHVVKLRLGDHLGNGLPGTIYCKDFLLARVCGDTGGGVTMSNVYTFLIRSW